MEMTKKTMRERKWVSSDSRSLYERQRAIASAKVRGCIVNPPVLPKVEGIFTFLETGVDDLAARMMGYDDGRAVIEARANGHLKGLEFGISVKIQPSVIFQPHPSHLNPTTQPLETCHHSPTHQTPHSTWSIIDGVLLHLLLLYLLLDCSSRKIRKMKSLSARTTQ